MTNPFRSHPYRSASIVAVLLIGFGWLAFGYFGVHTLFVDDVVSEAAPVFDAPALPSEPATDSVAPTTAPTTAPTIAAPPASAPAPAPADDTTTTTQPTIVTQYVGTFVGDAHPTAGRAVVLGNGTGQRFLRLEDFATDNGPDLNVYLVDGSTGDVSDAVDLGDLKGNVGEQNYEIPVGVDLTVYDQVVIWCVRFGVGFGSARLTAA